MPATGSIIETAETIAALPEIVELNIGHFLIGEAVYSRACRGGEDHARRDGSRPREGEAHDHRHRLRPHRHPAHRADDRAPRRALPRPHLHAGSSARKAERRADRVETYAKRFAAKEACAKALGTGLRAGVFWRDMGVVNLPSGRPTMQLTGGALARLQAITPAGCEARIDLTITDEGPMAQAFVVISAVPRRGVRRTIGAAVDCAACVRLRIGKLPLPRSGSATGAAARRLLLWQQSVRAGPTLFGRARHIAAARVNSLKKDANLRCSRLKLVPPDNS